MDVDAVINQLKTAAPFFAGRIAGGAEWELTRDQVWMAMPAAYVIPLELSAPENPDLTGLRQKVTQNIGIVVVMDNSPDRRGQTLATDAVGPVLKLLHAAVLNWRPETENAARGYWFVRAAYMQSDRARLIWQFEYALETFISELDGFQLPSVPLEDLRITETGLLTGTQLGVFDVPLPNP